MSLPNGIFETGSNSIVILQTLLVSAWVRVSCKLDSFCCFLYSLQKICLKLDTRHKGIFQGSQKTRAKFAEDREDLGAAK